MFDNWTNSLSKTYESYWNGNKSLVLKNTATAFSEFRSDSSEASHNSLRPLFGKQGNVVASIGDHPDFLHLKGTSLKEYCAITTMFMDLESSTRLGILYAPEDVFRIKNAFISTAIEIIKAFDGHVHRIMGDAVMAYFGGKNQSPTNAAINALNCSAVLNKFVEEVVIPKLQSEGYDRDFGIRVGLDHGPQEKVLWSSYGQQGMDEVTATSYFVDVASKLQHSAGRNQIMLGQSLKDLLDFPDELLEIKTTTRDGIVISEPILKPNLTDQSGQPINYKQFLLRWDEYLKYSPLPSLSSKNTGGITSPKVTLAVCDEKFGSTIMPYSATSYALPKNKWIKFKVQMPFLPQLPYKLRFSVKNHGKEAEQMNDDGSRGDHQTDIIVNTQHEHNNLVHWEFTSYRGLHYMNIEVTSSRGKISEASLGIYIE